MFVRAIKTVAFNQRDRGTFNTLLALANACASAQKEARQKTSAHAQTSATTSFPTPWLDNPDWVPPLDYFEDTGYGRGPCPALLAYVEHLTHKEDKEPAQKLARTGSL